MVDSPVYVHKKTVLAVLTASVCLTMSSPVEAEESAARTLVHAGVLIDGVSFVMKDGVVYRD